MSYLFLATTIIAIVLVIGMRLYFSKNPDSVHGCGPEEMDQARLVYRYMAKNLGWRYTYRWVYAPSDFELRLDPQGQWQLVLWCRFGLPKHLAISHMLQFPEPGQTRRPWSVWIIEKRIEALFIEAHQAIVK